MASSYIDQIDAQLAGLRMEIERLQIARDVISNLEGRGGGKVLTLKAEPSPSKQSGPFTIRKIGESVSEEPKEKKKRKLLIPRDKDRFERTRVTVREALELGPMTSGELKSLLDFTEKRDINMLYNILSKSVLAGTLLKDKVTGRISLPKLQEDTSDAA
jgi:hypothetical protein